MQIIFLAHYRRRIAHQRAILRSVIREAAT